MIDYILVLVSAGSTKEVSFKVDEKMEADVSSDHNWIWMDIRGAVAEKGKEKGKGRWKINKWTDLAKFMEDYW